MRPASRVANPTRILVADDDADVLTSTKMLLRRANIPDLEVVTVTSAEEGIEVLRATRFDVVITDQRMGRMSGLDFLDEVRQRFPATGRIMITGFADSDLAAHAINRAAVHAFVRKPWAPEAFIQTVRRVIADTRRKEAFEEAVARGFVGVTNINEAAAADAADA